jgi:hypothetical protein
MLRRILAITLLLAIGSALAAPVFAATADPEAALPACCRSHGTHHCAMQHTTLAASDGPVFQSPPCPHYPTAFTPLRTATASLSAAPGASIEIHRDRTALVQVSRPAAGNFASSSNLKRGPPALLA